MAGGKQSNTGKDVKSMGAHANRREVRVKMRQEVLAVGLYCDRIPSTSQYGAASVKDGCTPRAKGLLPAGAGGRIVPLF